MQQIHSLNTKRAGEDQKLDIKFAWPNAMFIIAGKSCTMYIIGFIERPIRASPKNIQKCYCTGTGYNFRKSYLLISPSVVLSWTFTGRIELLGSMRRMDIECRVSSSSLFLASCVEGNLDLTVDSSLC